MENNKENLEEYKRYLEEDQELTNQEREEYEFFSKVLVALQIAEESVSKALKENYQKGDSEQVEKLLHNCLTFVQIRNYMIERSYVIGEYNEKYVEDCEELRKKEKLLRKILKNLE